MKDLHTSGISRGGRGSAALPNPYKVSKILQIYMFGPAGVGGK